MESTDRVTRRRVVAASAGIVATTLAGCSSGGGSDTTTYQGPVVKVGPNGDYVFKPGTDSALTVDAGTTVTWVWESSNHNIVVGSQPDGANWQGTKGDQYTTYNKGHTLQHEFTVPGKYHYWCQPHKGFGMVADLVVRDNAN